jgi:hypothetical protein
MLLIPHARSWHYFHDAARLLFSTTAPGSTRLGLYALHPEFQFGPLSVVAARPFTVLPSPIEEWAVMVAGALAGIAVLALLVDVTRRLHPALDEVAVRRVVLLVSLPYLAIWMRLAAYTAHLDDVLVLTAMSGALSATARRRPGWATATVAVAIATKPWALVFVPLCCCGGGRHRYIRPVVAVLAAAASWLPFVLAHPETLSALRRFTISVDANSGLHVLGVVDGSTPGWLRPAQLVLGLAVTGVIAARKDRWPALLAAGMATRLLIDPATHHYYTAGFVVAALAWELTAAPERVPWRTAVAAVVLEVAASGIALGGAVALTRFLLLLGTFVAAAVGKADLPSVDRPQSSR